MKLATTSPSKAAKASQVTALISAMISLALALVPAAFATSSHGNADSDTLIVSPDVLGELDVLRRLDIAPLDSLPPVPSLDDYIGYAAAHNVELQASILQWRAVTEKNAQATSLPDPRFRFSEYLVPVETRVGPQLRSIGLSQTFPWFGTLSAQGKVVDERAAAAGARVGAVALEVAFRVRRTYHELAFLESATSINEEHLALLTQWEDVARSRYATGSGGYADVIKAQVEIGKLTDRVAELRDRFRPLSADLNAALSRPRNAPVPWPDWIVADGVQLDEDMLVESLSVDNPQLLGLQHQAASYQHAEDVAGKQGLPNFTLGLSYIQTGDAEMPGVADSGKDPVVATIAVNVPLWRGKYSAAEREASSSYLAVRATHRDRENALATALEHALFGYRDAVRKLNLYGDTLLPKGFQSLQATLAAYETGTAGFLDLVDAERLLLEFELSNARAGADLMIRLAEIEKIVGGPIRHQHGSTLQSRRADEE